MGGGGGGGGGGNACYPGKIRVLVTLRYRKVDLKLTNSVLKRNIFYNLKQQGSANKNGANVPGSTRDYCNLFALAFELRYLDLLHHADESQRRRTVTLLYRSGRVGVLQSYFFT